MDAGGDDSWNDKAIAKFNRGRDEDPGLQSAVWVVGLGSRGWRGMRQVLNKRRRRGLA